MGVIMMIGGSVLWMWLYNHNDNHQSFHHLSSPSLPPSSPSQLPLHSHQSHFPSSPISHHPQQGDCISILIHSIPNINHFGWWNQNQFPSHHPNPRFKPHPSLLNHVLYSLPCGFSSVKIPNPFITPLRLNQNGQKPSIMLYPNTPFSHFHNDNHLIIVNPLGNQLYSWLSIERNFYSMWV